MIIGGSDPHWGYGIGVEVAPRRNIFYTFSSFLWLSSSGRVSIHDGLPRPLGAITRFHTYSTSKATIDFSMWGKGTDYSLYVFTHRKHRLLSLEEGDAGRQIKGMGERQLLGELLQLPTFFSASRRKHF